MASFARNWPLAASPGRGTARKRFVSTVGSSGFDSHGLATILKKSPTIFGFFGTGPLSEYLTHFEILEIQFFNNKPHDYAH